MLKNEVSFLKESIQTLEYIVRLKKLISKRHSVSTILTKQTNRFP